MRPQNITPNQKNNDMIALSFAANRHVLPGAQRAHPAVQPDV